MEEFGISNSNYSKIENGVREITVKELQKLSRLFDMTLDQIVNFDRDIPEEVTLKDKSNMEPLNLINQLDDEDRKPSLRSLIPCSPKRSLKT
ncbi:MAG: helix-turn-helix transcriptional regulator, partial [Cytophagales bacterium]|nr:helix-turn-helix transcriptional regulator [Cytophagales bacterium]